MSPVNKCDPRPGGNTVLLTIHHPDRRVHNYKKLRQVPTHLNAQLSESDMQKFIALSRATHQSQGLASESKFRANHPLHVYLTSYSQTFHPTLPCTITLVGTKGISGNTFSQS